MSKKKGGFKFFSRSSKNTEEELRRELEEKTKGRRIDMKALEESRREKARQGHEKEQKDFRHLLQRTDQAKPKKSSVKTGAETDQQHSSGQNSRLQERKKRGRSMSPQGTELTGSWDFIPSAPSSTVDLTPSARKGGKHSPQHQSPVKQHSTEHHEPHSQMCHQPAEPELHYGEEGGGEEEEEDCDEMGASSPAFDLSYATGASEELPRETNWGQPNQDYDYETQF